MPGNPHKYTDEYRRETADYALSTGKPIACVARELGVNDKTLHKWVRDRRAQLENPTAYAQAQAEDAELKAAKKRIRELEMENEFLKKPPPSSPKSEYKR